MQGTLFCAEADTGQQNAGSRFDYDKYIKEYRARNPAKVLQWRLNQAANLLKRNGWTVTPPDAAKDGELR